MLPDTIHNQQCRDKSCRESLLLPRFRFSRLLPIIAFAVVEHWGLKSGRQRRQSGEAKEETQERLGWRGVTTIDYGLIAALIGVFIITILGDVGTAIKTTFTPSKTA